jgi:hypothetical protein
MKRVLAERVDAQKSELFLLSEKRLEEEVSGESVRYLDRYIDEGRYPDSRVFWVNHGDGIDIDEEYFNHIDGIKIVDYCPCIPIISLGDLQKFTENSPAKNYEAVERAKNFIFNSDSASDIQKHFTEYHISEHYTRESANGADELLDRILGYGICAGELHLLTFVPQGGERMTTLLYFTPKGISPEPNEDGMICFNGEPIIRDVYCGFDGNCLRDLYYGQDNRKNVSMKGDFELFNLGEVSINRNAFRSVDFNRKYSRSILMLLCDKDEK